MIALAPFFPKGKFSVSVTLSLMPSSRSWEQGCPFNRGYRLPFWDKNIISGLEKLVGSGNAPDLDGFHLVLSICRPLNFAMLRNYAQEKQSQANVFAQTAML